MAARAHVADDTSRDAAVAYTYAWWLTGDAEPAAAAVRAALAHREHDDDLARLLRRVRQAAIPSRTMCPASELALLHDRQGLPLDVAATLSDVPEADARTELAHGRLEALLETVDADFTHPERLGGLAVGNPADVAHARQCDSCARVKALLASGRDALCGLPAVPPPTGLLADLFPVPVDGAPARRCSALLVAAVLMCLAATAAAAALLFAGGAAASAPVALGAALSLPATWSRR